MLGGLAAKTAHPLAHDSCRDRNPAADGGDGSRSGRDGASSQAAFIYNFAKFTEWPTDVIPTGEPIVLCVLGDVAIEQALEQAVKGRSLAGHSMTVVRAEPAKRPLEGCHLLFISGATAGEAAKVVAGLGEAPVLTISAAEGFTEQGGIAQFFFVHGQLRFNIHLESAKRARLRLSSRLLALARTQ
jgi:hypothetical protein